MKNIYSDLAIEFSENLNASEEDIEIIEKTVNDIVISKIIIKSDKIANELEKEKGTYLNISIKNDVEKYILDDELVSILSNKIIEIAELKENSKILIIGLGNHNVTADSLGPRVINNLLVTRHLAESIPDDLKNKLRSVSAISPGVLGTTGIETAEIVKAISNEIEPDIIFAIDALAAKNVERINRTIQLSDSGISPGSGMGNNRQKLNQETLGRKVIAIGVPTIVDAATLVNDSLSNILDDLINFSTKENPMYNILLENSLEDKYQIISESLDKKDLNMYVSPRNIDSMIEKFSHIIANALNIALHPGLDEDDIGKFLY